MASKTRQQWPGRSHIAIYVRSLHILNLDLLSDWPGLDEQSLGPKSSLQQRVRSVEWSLYRLLEIHDPRGTQDKLKPFFPPTTPLQSLNLRAALYRVLTDLKKNGVLGRETSLRKTMLDECKGEKFEEVIAAVAMLVLRKVNGQGGGRQRINLGARHTSQTLPLILAHRNALQRNIESRKAIRLAAEERIQQFHDLEQRLARREQEIKTTPVPSSRGDDDDLTRLVYSNWFGPQGWADVILQGRPMPIEILSTSQGHPELTGEGSSSDKAKAPTTVLDDLEHRLKLHESTLAEWKSILKDLGPKPKQANRQGDSLQQQSLDRMTMPLLARHADLHLQSKSIEATHRPDTVLPAYQHLLDLMHNELTSRPSRGHTMVAKTRPDDSPSLGSPAGVMPPPSSPQVLDKEPYQISADSEIQIEKQGEEFFEQQEPEITQESSVQSRLEDSPSSSWIPNAEISSSPPLTSRFTRTTIPSTPPSLEPTTNSSSVVNTRKKLSDRARASMSVLGKPLSQPDTSATVIARRTDLKEEKENEDESSDAFPLIDKPSSLPPPWQDQTSSSLLERTRLSMSLLPKQSNIVREPRKGVRPSQVFPINQFETPHHKQASALWSDGKEDSSRASTPRDKLFDEEADYASVFRSRPRVAVSPALSPQRTGLDLDDDDLQRNMDGLALGDD